MWFIDLQKTKRMTPSPVSCCWCRLCSLASAYRRTLLIIQRYLLYNQQNIVFLEFMGSSRLSNNDLPGPPRAKRYLLVSRGALS